MMSELLNVSGGTIGRMNETREQTMKRWSELGFLEGLTGDVKTNIAQMYECCASSLLNEVDITGDTTDLIVYKKD
jgi:hypothetical protein